MPCMIEVFSIKDDVSVFVNIDMIVSLTFMEMHDNYLLTTYLGEYFISKTDAKRILSTTTTIYKKED